MTRSAYHALCLLIISATFGVAYLSLHHPNPHSLRHHPPLHLTETQQSALRGLAQVKIEAYVQNNPRMRRAISELMQELRAEIPALSFEFHSLERDPITAQARGIQREGQLYLTIDGDKSTRIDQLSPLSIVNAILKLEQHQQSQLVHLQGHGERGFLSDSAGSWLAFYQQYQGGDLIQAAITQGEIPLPAESILLIIDPQSALSDADEAELRAHIQAGNSVLYTTDSQKPYLPKALSELSGLSVAEGVMIDADSHDKYGLENPQWLVIEQLGDSEVTRALKNAPILPTAVALLPQNEPREGFTRTPLLWTGERSWSEKNPLADQLQANDDEVRGSQAVAWQLSRQHPQHPERQQFIFMIGDSDLGNSLYFSAGNRALLNQMLQVMRAKTLSLVQNPPRPDQFITLSPQSALGLGALLIVGLPVLPLLVWWRMRRARKVLL